MSPLHGCECPSTWTSCPESFWLHSVDTIGYEVIHVRCGYCNWPRVIPPPLVARLLHFQWVPRPDSARPNEWAPGGPWHPACLLRRPGGKARRSERSRPEVITRLHDRELPGSSDPTRSL